MLIHGIKSSKDRRSSLSPAADGRPNVWEANEEGPTGGTPHTPQLVAEETTSRGGLWKFMSATPVLYSLGLQNPPSGNTQA